jgi:hypothetical protein
VRQLERESLAWAAGFFDGEGGTYLQKNGTQVALVVGQAGEIDAPPGVLVKLKEALGGLGQVYGPYRLADPRRRPKWSWQLHTFERCQAVIAMIWPWLSDVKKKQAVRVLRIVRGRNGGPGSG